MSLGNFSKPHFRLKNIMLLKDLCVVSLLLIFFSLFTYGYFHIPLFLFIFSVISFYWASQHCGWESSCICGTCDRNSVSFKLRHSAIKISVFFRIWSPLFFCFFLKILLNLRSLYILVIVSSLNSVGVDLNHKYWEPDVGWQLCVCQFISCINWKTGLFLESELDTV